MIFSRGRGSGRHAKGDTVRGDARGATREQDDTGSDPDDVESGHGVTVGPYDVSEAPEGISQLDLGALRLAAVDGVEVRVQADPDGKIQQVLLVHGDSALQLGAFAAPRVRDTGVRGPGGARRLPGIWDEVREEIRQQLFNDGVAAQEVEGDYGVELRARVRTPDGLADIRFAGVNGLRWLVRAVYQGPAAVDPTAAAPLLECLHKLVVDRGQEAMPVRDPLPLRLPREIADHGGEEEGEGPPGINGESDNGGAAARRPSPGRRKPSPRPRRRP